MKGSSCSHWNSTSNIGLLDKALLDFHVNTVYTVCLYDLPNIEYSGLPAAGVR